ncbi:MAG: right-handed parallel beta-helix repeat-containing protein [Planctomycetes bacterium]|nr:right-handed parallel beta-helix repeat-containing protein [Planctomycetota bacterium]
MQRQRNLQSLLVLAGILLTPWAGRLFAQPVIPADLHVDDDNAGMQDGSALRPYRTVQSAIKAAKANSVIAVAGGIYAENIRVEEKAVRLYGGYKGGTAAAYAAGTAGNFKVRDTAANPSHLKGDGKDSVVSLQEAGASVVDGFLITGGGRSVLGAPLFLGGGVYVYGGSPTISNNVIEKNQTCPPVVQKDEKFGGGIYAADAKISILNNIIRNNVAGRGAGISANCPKVIIRGNTVQNNIGVSDHGGGIFLFSPDAEVSHNRIEGNEIGRAMKYGWGGGLIVVSKGGNYKLSHNVFTGNYAPSVGSAFFVDEGADATMDHDLVYANADNPDAEGTVVAPVYVDGADDKIGSTLIMNHVTVADHSTKSTAKSHAISVTGKSKLTIKNSILWNNGGNDIAVDNISTSTASYTLGEKALKGTGNISKDPLFANPAGRDYRLRENSPAIKAGEGGANLGTDLINKKGKDTGIVTKEKEPDPKTPKTPPTEKAAKAYLLRGTEGELPSEVGDDKTKMTKVDMAVQVDLIDTFGQRAAKVEDWTPFHTLRLDIVNKGEKELEVGFNLFHSGTKAFATRVVAPFVLKPGKNEIRIAVKDLKNTNGSAAKLAEVRRWYVASETPVTLLVGDIYLEGKEGKEGGGTAYKIKTDPARLERIKSTKMPKFDKPVLYNTPEGDAIMSAADIFPADNPWNTLVEDWPVHPNSQKIVASIGANKFLRYNADMAFVIVPPNQKKVDVKPIEYMDESDPGPYPVADNTPIEGWPKSFLEDPKLKSLTLDDVQRGKPDLEADRHGIVYDPVNRKLYEFYRLTKTDRGWKADQASIFDLSSNKLRPDGWTSSDAAGLPILPAIVRYDEIKRGVIDHALRFTVQRSRRAYVYPATHFASKLTDENLPRMGERFRLRKDFDTSKFSPEARVILEALKRYGMLMADNGMDWGLSVSGDDRLPVFHEEFRRVKGSDFEVVTPPQGYVTP